MSSGNIAYGYRCLTHESYTMLSHPSANSEEPSNPLLMNEAQLLGQVADENGPLAIGA